MALVRKMGSPGLTTPELPEEFRSMGAGTLHAGIIIEEIGRADLPSAMCRFRPR